MNNKECELDIPDLECFTNTPKRETPIIAITKVGGFSLSKAFLYHAEKEMNGKTHVALYYSKSNNIVCLKFTNNVESNRNFKLTKTDTVSFAGKSFFGWTQHNIDAISGKYVAKLKYLPELGAVWTIFLKS